MNWFTRLANPTDASKQGAPASATGMQQQGQPRNSNFQNPQGGNGGQQQQGQQPQNQQQQEPVDPSDQLRNEIWGAPSAPQGSQQQQGGQQQPQPQGQQQPQAPQYQGYTVPWDQQQIRTSLSQMDFMRNINPEVMTRLQGGDWSALGEIMNSVARQTLELSMQTSHGFVDRGVQTGLDRFGRTLDDRFRNYEIRGQTPDDELISHPANAPVFEMLKQRVATQNPSYTPAQVKEIAVRWFKNIGEASVSKQQSQNGQQKSGPDWGATFGVDEMQQNGDNFQPFY